MTTVSVPGKIHLMGEHAVVYGTPAILAAIDKRMTVSVEKNGTTEIVTAEPPEYVLYALDVVKKSLHLPSLPPMKITITSDIPAGFHLGSSAATAVGVVAAVLYFIKKIWNPTQINALAYEVEKKQHGNPSGGDNTAVTFGGIVWFRKELEFLKSLWQLNVAIPPTLNHFFLVDTGKPKETTGEMVAFVRSKYKKNPSFIQHQFLKNEEQVKRIAVSLKNHDEAMLVHALRQGQRTLENIGVVGKKVIPFIRDIEKNNGAAKILGGGGKIDGVGFLLCYHKRRSVVRKIGKKYGYRVQPVTLGSDGVRLEQK